MRDGRLRQLGKRLIAFFAPNLLTAQQKLDFDNFIKARWTNEGDNTKWNTIQTIIDDLEEMKEESLDVQYISSLQNFYSEHLRQHKIDFTM